MRSTINLIKLVYFRFRDDKGIQIAGSLTFTTLLALVPLLTVALTIFSTFPVFEDLSVQFKIFLLMNLVPVSAGKIITVYMQQFADNATQLTVLGIIALFITAIAQLHTIERSFNSIWRVRRERPIFQRMLIYWALLTIGPMLIGASLSLSSWLISFSRGWITARPMASIALLKLVPLALTALAFALMYFTVPNKRIAKRDALIGGVVAAAAFEGMNRGFGWYIANVPTYNLIYGAFASIPIFLMWIYLSWLVVIFGAVTVATLPSWREGKWQTEQTLGKKFFDALSVLKAFYEAHGTGDGVTLVQLRGVLKLTSDDTDEILEKLCAIGWASRTASGGWILSREMETITVADVYELFISLPDPETQAPALRTQLTELNHRLQDQMQNSLREFFESRGEVPKHAEVNPAS